MRAPRRWCRPSMPAPISSCTPPAGWRAGSPRPTRNSSWTSTSSAAMHVLAKGVDLSENGQAMDAFHQVEPGGHYLGCAHTQANFETAFYRSSVADNNSVEQWEAEGGQDAPSPRQQLWKKMLADYEGRRRSIPASTRRCGSSSRRRRRRCRPTPSLEASPTQAGLKWPTSSTRKSGGALSPNRTRGDGGPISPRLTACTCAMIWPLRSSPTA